MAKTHARLIVCDTLLLLYAKNVWAYSEDIDKDRELTTLLIINNLLWNITYNQQTQNKQGLINTGFVLKLMAMVCILCCVYVHASIKKGSYLY